MTDPASDHSVVPFPLHPPEMESPGRRLVERALEGDALRKMLDELNRESPHAAGPYYVPRPESLAWAFLGLLEDPQYRPEFKSIFHVPDDFGGDDSSLVHILAVSWAIVEAAREIDATLDRLWRSADHERRMAQAIARHLAPTFGGAAVEDDVIRHARQAQKYVLEARTYQNPPARVVAEALGRHLEPYFISRHRKISSAPNGWRPAGRIAGLVADMTGQQVTETDVRRWCGWKNKAEAQAKAEAAATTSESIRPQI